MQRFVLLFLTLLGWSLTAQELPPVVAYEADEYGAGTQNWMIGQDEDLFIYAANNQGLLEFNGQKWTLYPSPNETIIRSVYAVDKRIYTGCYMDFGVWERNEEGKLDYRSLSAKVADRLQADEQFWGIFTYDGYIVFRSFNQFFLYRPQDENITVLTPPKGVKKAFPTADGIYFTGGDDKLYQISGGLITAIASEPQSLPPVVHLWEENGETLLQTGTSGAYRMADGLLKKDDLHAVLTGKQIYCATTLKDGGHAFGTISDGIYVIGADGALQHHLSRVDGLTNNTILSLFEDNKGNLWAGTDNGISYLNLSSPFRKYTDVTGQIGTVHASAMYQGKLYLGSNQGLFAHNVGSDDPFLLVDGTKGQVWSLFQHAGRLFGGHDRGAFVVTADGVDFFLSGTGVWTFTPPPGDTAAKLLLGTYEGVWVAEGKEGRWSARNKIEGFDYSCRFLAPHGTDELYISHEYRGLFGLRLDGDLRRVVERRDYEAPTKGKNAGLAVFAGNVYYQSRHGVFRLEDFATGFLADQQLGGTIDTAEYVSGNMTMADDQLWLFTKKDISYFRKGADGTTVTRYDIAVPAALVNSKSGYENISAIGDDVFLIGEADGYLMMDIDNAPDHDHSVYLTNVTARTGNGESRSLNTERSVALPFTENNLSFSFTVPVFDRYFTPYFSYRLRGLTDEWSAWSTKSTATFPGLAYGDYELEARSVLGQEEAKNTISYSFTVHRPWYAAYLALLLYAIAGLLLIFLLHRTYTRHYRNKETLWRQENERKIEEGRREAELSMSRLQNEKLEEDIAAKNREVASSTMNLVKKNELLQQIKAELQSNGEPKENIKKVIKTIDKNIDEAETWNLFRDAFESADQDFFRKIKGQHPSLTPNDLKLCAYLRLNLSSKEIAPMLNISSRSVEVKRYRLRKKMGLERETGLVDYILSL